MSQYGPIILIDDDLHDLDVTKAAIIDIGYTNEIVTFTEARLALQFLVETPQLPFVILCDIIMTEMNGLDFRNFINSDDFLRKKSIPFIFLTAAVSQKIVNEAYNLTVQGFLEKPKTFTELKTKLSQILDYWSICIHPNSF